MTSSPGESEESKAAHRSASAHQASQAYRLEAVWPSPSEMVREQVVNFWMTALPSSDLRAARERAHQLIVVARDSAGEVAGVSTAVRVSVDQLGFECFYYRTFVGCEHRVRGIRSTKLASRILQESFRLLNARYQQGHDSKVLGLYTEIENHSIMKNRNEAVWTDNGMNFVYIGRTREGRHLRLWYFDGARIP